MWDNINDKLPIQVASHLNNMDEDDLFDNLIGGSHYPCNMEQNIIDIFIIIIANSIIDLFNKVIALLDNVNKFSIYTC